MSPSATENQSAETSPHVASDALYRDGLKEKPKVQMPKLVDLGMPSFDDPYKARAYLKGRLVLAFRIFAKFGFDDGVAGHITLRDPVEPTSFWLNPFGKAWATMTVDDLILVNEDGKVVDGGPNRLLNAAAYAIHHQVHVARPDVNCVAHSHSVYGKAFSALGRNLDMITQDACAFHNDVALYASKGIVLDAEEGRAIAEALGNKKAAILQNHGLITLGNTIESCIYWYLALEKSCQAQLLADAAASGRGERTIKVSEEDAAYTYKTVGSEVAGWFSAKPVFELAESAAAQI
ncbi:arad-like aldolase/epimerase [Coniochaeta sp. PMI_546]|nr:arad-like aldolase/epimerase [Coniochaeta sp. PMI_546]